LDVRLVMTLCSKVSNTEGNKSINNRCIHYDNYDDNNDDHNNC
jgi:hypothetical protein